MKSKHRKIVSTGLAASWLRKLRNVKEEGGFGNKFTSL